MTYKTTMFACFGGYIVQAILINFMPLLFVTFQDRYGIALDQLTLLLTVNFIVQLVVDYLATRFVDRVGYRPCVLAAHGFSALGLVCLSVLPEVLPPFMGLISSVVLCAIGGGLIEVLISPIMESCPTDNKEAAMSLLHSFYCWGMVGVVALSTLFFRLAGIGAWRILALLWAGVCACNGLLFIRTPIAPLIASGETGMTTGQLMKNRTFWLMALMMVCAGAAENGMVQWSSAFAERGLGISKTVGDLAGPMFFALLMGTVRALHGKYGERLDLDRLLPVSAVGCIVSYLMTSLLPWPFMNLLGCAFCGIGVACMWPGTLSKASAALRTGGTAMFALLAMAGDIGCSAGSTLVGMVADAAGGDMKAGILAGTVFPVLMLAVSLLQGRRKRAPVQEKA